MMFICDLDVFHMCCWQNYSVLLQPILRARVLMPNYVLGSSIGLPPRLVALKNEKR